VVAFCQSLLLMLVLMLVMMLRMMAECSRRGCDVTAL